MEKLYATDRQVKYAVHLMSQHNLLIDIDLYSLKHYERKEMSNLISELEDMVHEAECMDAAFHNEF